MKNVDLWRVCAIGDVLLVEAESEGIKESLSLSCISFCCGTDPVVGVESHSGAILPLVLQHLLDESAFAVHDSVHLGNHCSFSEAQLVIL